MRGEFVDLDDTRLYCYASGSRGAGEPIVLLHGAFTSSHVWRDLTARLPKGHRVLVVDLLGHGRSDQPALGELDIASHTTKLGRLFDVLGLEPACFLGHGVGAAIAARIALQSPARVSRLLLCNPCHLAAEASPAQAPRALRRLARGMPLWRRLPPDWFASALHASLIRGYTNRLFAGHAMDVYLKPFRSDAGRSIACRQLSAMADRHDVTHLHAQSLTIPVSLVLGDRDPFVGASGERLWAALPTVTSERHAVHRLAGLSHAIPEEAPDRLAVAVAELLAQ